MPSSQIMGLYNRLIRKFNGQFRSLEEEEAGKDLPITLPASTEMEAMEEDLETELRGAAKEMEKKFSEERKQLDAMDLSKYGGRVGVIIWGCGLTKVSLYLKYVLYGQFEVECTCFKFVASVLKTLNPPFHFIVEHCYL